MGATRSSGFLERLCRPPHSLRLREFNCHTLTGADLRALAAVSTLTELQPTCLALGPADLESERLFSVSQLRRLQWYLGRSVLTAAQSLQAFEALGLRGLTTLRFFGERFSDEQLGQLLTPLTQLQELLLYNKAARSAAFLQVGSLPRTLRTLRIWTKLPAASLEQVLPALQALESLLLMVGSDRAFALAPLVARLRVPSELLPQLRYFSNKRDEWIGPPSNKSPFV